MTLRIWVWLRGDFLLDSFLPLGLSSASQNRCMTEKFLIPPSTIEKAHTFIDECVMRKWDQLSVGQWYSITKEIGFDNALSEAIFRSASRSQAIATVPSIALHLLLVGLECFEANESITTRGDVVTAMVHEQMEDFIRVLCRSVTSISRAAVEKDKIVFTNAELKRFLSLMDTLFEGMMKDDVSNDSRDEIVSMSRIMKKLWLGNAEVSIRTLSNNIRRCFVQDPFAIDDLTLNAPSYLKRKLTTLADGRRKVTVSGWERLQLLLKVHHSNISLMCKQLHLWNCSNITVFLHTIRPPVLRGCRSVRFGVFNVSYEGITEEIEAAGLQSNRYSLVSHVVNLDGSECSTLPPSGFFIQPVPMVNSEKDVKDLLDKLPSVYRRAWEKSQMLASSKLRSGDNFSLPLRKSDLIYLRRKVVNEEFYGDV